MSCNAFDISRLSKEIEQAKPVDVEKFGLNKERVTCLMQSMNDPVDMVHPLFRATYKAIRGDCFD